MALDNPQGVIARLREAGESLTAAHRAAGEREGDLYDLTGPVRDAIYGINSTVDALIQMIDDET